jgi:Glycosyl transferase family 2
MCIVCDFFFILSIEYHRMIGFESFYLLNNDSTDATQCILDAYIKRGIVVQMNPKNDTDKEFGEHQVFDKCVDRLMWERDNNNKEASDGDDLANTWMATHDVDEFIWFQDTTTITSAAPADSTTTLLPSSPSFSPTLLQTAVHNLQQRHPAMQSMFIPRYLFGSSGYNHFQPGLVIKRYTHRFDPTGCQQPQQAAAAAAAVGDDNTHQRRLTIAFDKDNGGPTSFCNPSQNVTTAYHGAGKGMTLVNVLARDCRSPNKPTQKLSFCQGTHFHKLRNASHPNPTGVVFVRGEDWERHPTTLGDARYVGDADIVHDIAIVHYMTRSREEFFRRTCSSRWIEKYQRCPTCSPETYFNLSETYTNNFVDERMAPFATRLESILLSSNDSSSSLVDISQCQTAPPKTMPWTFYRNCWQRKKRGSGKKAKVVVEK